MPQRKGMYYKKIAKRVNPPDERDFRVLVARSRALLGAGTGRGRGRRREGRTRQDPGESDAGEPRQEADEGGGSQDQGNVFRHRRPQDGGVEAVDEGDEGPDEGGPEQEEAGWTLGGEEDEQEDRADEGTGR